MKVPWHDKMCTVIKNDVVDVCIHTDICAYTNIWGGRLLLKVDYKIINMCSKISFCFKIYIFISMWMLEDYIPKCELWLCLDNDVG